MNNSVEHTENKNTSIMQRFSPKSPPGPSPRYWEKFGNQDYQEEEEDNYWKNRQQTPPLPQAQSNWPKSPSGTPPTPYNSRVEELKQQSQQIFDEILEGMPKSSTTININRVLYGKIEINLTIHKLDNIQKIAFTVPGGIEQIYFTEPPLKLKKLDASNQAINTWNNVSMPYIEELNLSNNKLTNISLTPYEHLKSANLSKNSILHLNQNKGTNPADLPATLTIINLSNNRLSYLDLSFAKNLKALNVTGNKGIKLVNKPSGLYNLIGVEDSPLFDSHMDASDMGSKTKSRDDYDYEKSLEMYFLLKSEYESKYLTMLTNAYESKKTRDDRISALEAVRPLCIQCNRPVGTLFTRKKSHKLYAKCGDTENPCDLNITIFTGIHTKINDEVNTAAADLEESKELIIRHKMDTLFKYMSETESVEKFKLLINNYEDVKYYYNYYLTLYNETYFSEVRKQAIAEKLQTLYDISTELNKMVDELYDNQAAVQKYMDEYLPELQKLRGYKYEIMELDWDENNKITPYTLNQNEVGLERMTHVFNEKPKVISFVFSGIIPPPDEDKKDKKERKEKAKKEPKAKQTKTAQNEDEMPDLDEDRLPDVEEMPQPSPSQPSVKATSPELSEKRYLSSEQNVDVFDFEPEDHRRINDIMSRHFRGLELHLRTAIMIDYVFNYPHQNRDEIMEEIDSYDTQTLQDMTDMFDAHKYLTAWYQHYAPEKVDDVDNIIQKYNNMKKQSKPNELLFNNLYKKYVDSNAEYERLWVN